MSKTPLLRKTLEPIEATPSSLRGGRRYALVDPAPVHGLPRDYVPDDTDAIRLKPRHDDDPDCMPWLFEIEPRHHDWLKRRLPLASWGILVDSGASLSELGAVLSDLLLAIDPEGSEVLLRYYDPRVLAPLLDSMNERELARWFKVVRSFGRNFHDLMQWFTPAATWTSLPGTLNGARFQLREEHLFAFVDPHDHVLIDEVRAFIEDERPGVLDGIDEPAADLMIMAGIARARSHDLQETPDIAAFVAIMFDVAPNFDEQPQIRTCFDQRLLPGPWRLRLAIYTCSDEAWDDAEENSNPEAWFTNDSDSTGRVEVEDLERDLHHETSSPSQPGAEALIVEIKESIPVLPGQGLSGRSL